MNRIEIRVYPQGDGMARVELLDNEKTCVEEIDFNPELTDLDILRLLIKACQHGETMDLLDFIRENEKDVKIRGIEYAWASIRGVMDPSLCDTIVFDTPAEALAFRRGFVMGRHLSIFAYPDDEDDARVWVECESEAAKRHYLRYREVK